MNLNIQGHHVDLTDSLRNYVSGKIERLERHMDGLLEINVILAVEKLRHKAEATLHVSGANLFAESVEDDMYAAIDGLVDKLDRQVRKHKEKRVDHHAREADKRSYG